MNNRIVTILFLLTLAAFSHQAQAGAWRLGGGAQSVDFGDDLRLVDRGFGFIFSGAYQAGDVVSLDIQFGGSVHDEQKADEYAFYSYLMLGGKFSMSTGDVQPYFTAGITLNSVDFDEFQTISGEGVYWGLGMDILISANHAINVSYRASDWNGEDDVFDYDVSNSYFGVAYNFRFSP